MNESSKQSDETRPPPVTAGGEAWRRAEDVHRRLAETGDTARSFLVKGTIGCASLVVVAGFGIWLLISMFRWLVR